MPTARDNAILEARRWIEAKPLFLDTETNGLHDPIIEICVLDHDGVILFETLVNPGEPIEPEATAVHGITDATVKDAPAFADIWPRLRAVLANRHVVIYNADFDKHRICDSAEDREGRINDLWNEVHAFMWDYQGFNSVFDAPIFHCAMELYAEFYDDWSEYHGNYRWQKLGAAAAQCGIETPEGAHRARMDAETCRQVVRHVAVAKLESETNNDELQAKSATDPAPDSAAAPLS